MNSTVRMNISMAESEGLEVIEVITGGRHQKLRVRAKDGREHVFPFPSNVNSRRSEKNRRAQLRRFARGAE